MNKQFRILATVVTLLFAGMAVAQQSANLPTEDQIKSFVQHMVGYDPKITYKVTSIKPAEAPGFSEVTVVLNNGQGDQVLNFFVTPDQRFAMVGQMMDFGTDPFARYRTLLEKASGPIRGPQNAKVTIIEFADLECPACKAALPNIERMQQENPEVRVLFQNFPLEKVHPWAYLASEYVECLKGNSDVAWKFIDSVYEHQSEISKDNADQLLTKYATDAGGDAAKVKACIADPKTKAAVYAGEKLGEDLGVTSTPTVFVNGRKISSFNSLPYETFKQLVDFALKEGK